MNTDRAGQTWFFSICVHLCDLWLVAFAFLLLVRAAAGEFRGGAGDFLAELAVVGQAAGVERVVFGLPPAPAETVLPMLKTAASAAAIA